MDSPPKGRGKWRKKEKSENRNFVYTFLAREKMATSQASRTSDQDCKRQLGLPRKQLRHPRRVEQLSFSALCPTKFTVQRSFNYKNMYNLYVLSRNFEPATAVTPIGRPDIDNWGCVYTCPDRSGYPDVSAPDRPSVYTKTIKVYAIRSNTLRFPELFENDFKGGSSGCPGALRTRVNGASGYPDVTAHALSGFLRLESGFWSGFFLLPASFKPFFRSSP